jgi:hypothetical protein
VRWPLTSKLLPLFHQCRRRLRRGHFFCPDVVLAYSGANRLPFVRHHDGLFAKLANN